MNQNQLVKTGSNPLRKMRAMQIVMIAEPLHRAILFFVLKAGNGQEIGRSEIYQGGEAAMENGIKSVMTNAPDATLVDTTAG